MGYKVLKFCCDLNNSSKLSKMILLAYAIPVLPLEESEGEWWPVTYAVWQLQSTTQYNNTCCTPTAYIGHQKQSFQSGYVSKNTRFWNHGLWYLLIIFKSVSVIDFSCFKTMKDIRKKYRYVAFNITAHAPHSWNTELIKNTEERKIIYSQVWYFTALITKMPKHFICIFPLHQSIKLNVLVIAVWLDGQDNLQDWSKKGKAATIL